jgi:hypothetical protein
MRKHFVVDSLNSLCNLELKVSPSALSVGALLAAPLVAAHQGFYTASDEPRGPDPLPPPEPPPPPFPGPNPPIGWPPVPPSGPVGPG